VSSLIIMKAAHNRWSIYCDEEISQADHLRWSDAPCWLSTTTYSTYSQLVFVLPQPGIRP